MGVNVQVDATAAAAACAAVPSDRRYVMIAVKRHTRYLYQLSHWKAHYLPLFGKL